MDQSGLGAAVGFVIGDTLWAVGEAGGFLGSRAVNADSITMEVYGKEVCFLETIFFWFGLSYWICGVDELVCWRVAVRQWLCGGWWKRAGWLVCGWKMNRG